MNAPIATEIRFCRACGSSALSEILSLGLITISDFLPPDAPNPPSVPVELVICEDCDLVQIRHSANPDKLFRQGYWYESGINETMRVELQSIAVEAALRVGLTSKDTVVDVGANDGTLLRAYTGLGPVPTKVAFEPATRFYDRLRPLATFVSADFFPQGLKHVGLQKRSVTILTSIACFYDVENPLAFVEAVDHLLTDDGVWVVQFQDLAGMLGANGFDNLCLEHLCHYSLRTFDALLQDFDLAVVDVQRRAINGGSIRVTVQRKSHNVSSSVVEAWKWEEDRISRDRLHRFAHRSREIAFQLKGLVEQINRRGLFVDLYAASTKSSVLLQTAGLTSHEIRCAAERTPQKYGLVTSGTRIPIIPEGEWRADPAPFTIVGAWGFREAFLLREAEYLSKGGSFICAIPNVEVLKVAKA